jgi:hypothetical protein
MSIVLFLSSNIPMFLIMNSMIKTEYENYKNAHDILGITYPKNESIWKYFHAK